MEHDYGKIKLTLTRHGETEENVKKLISGQSPGTLTQEGIDQAKKIGVYLKDELYDHIYVSDLKRTVDTFNNIKGETKYFQNIETQYLPLLRQKSAGIYDGKPRSSKKQQEAKSNIHTRDYKPQNGQSSNEVFARCAQFLQILICDHIINQKVGQKKLQPKHIFVVTHSVVIMQFYNVVNKLMENIDPAMAKKFEIFNCSLHDFQISYPLAEKNYEEGKIKIKNTRSNFIDHLK